MTRQGLTFRSELPVDLPIVLGAVITKRLDRLRNLLQQLRILVGIVPLFTARTSAISRVLRLIAKCGFRQVRRLDLPCLPIFLHFRRRPSDGARQPTQRLVLSVAGLLRNVQLRSPFGQRREVGNIDIDRYQWRRVTAWVFGLSIRQTEQFKQQTKRSIASLL